MLKILKNLFRTFFRGKNNVKIGFYGPPNAGKTSIANLICKDWLGEDIGVVSEVPHETREVQFKEKVEITHKGKSLMFKIVDTPGIATRIDYEDFLRYGLRKGEAKKRAKEATQGIIKRIKEVFPDYEVVGISAKKKLNIDKFYEALFRLAKRA